MAPGILWICAIQRSYFIALNLIIKLLLLTLICCISDLYDLKGIIIKFKIIQDVKNLFPYISDIVKVYYIDYFSSFETFELKACPNRPVQDILMIKPDNSGKEDNFWFCLFKHKQLWKFITILCSSCPVFFFLLCSCVLHYLSVRFLQYFFLNKIFCKHVFSKIGTHFFSSPI